MNPSPQLEEEIFIAAIAMPAAERAEFVIQQCGRDSATVERVLALVQGYERNSAFLENAPAATERQLAREFASRLPPEPRPGDSIGRYRLLERIGEGGFSVVFLAEQSEPVRRRVALKILRIGMDTHEFIVRFEAERQALALMDHPNVARVFDAGATETGRPFLVMELISGSPITAYCDQHRLTLRARLTLFLQVCAALQHAHQKGIIHRDLKPSNVLVAEDSGAPLPKLIDFGIAKAIRTPLTDRVLVTMQHSLIGTPAYTSPEQLDTDGRAADTRSDIYSLGALLYELLAGRPPFDREALERASLEELRRTIHETEPLRPSQRVAALPSPDRAVVATQRGVDSARLVPLLRTDLDWIAMRCLEKYPSRRYETASALAADIRRHLQNEPVLARPPSRVYQISKFIRRHRTWVLASTAVLVALVYALIATRFSLARETAARERAVVAERTQSELRREAEDARAREARRASRAVIDLATQRLAEGRTADALAYFVQAAQQDPANPVLAPRIASLLTSRSFLLPQGAIARHAAPVLAADYSDDGKRLIAVWRDGTYGNIDLATGKVTFDRLGSELRVAFSYLPTHSYILVYCADGVIRTLDRQSGRIVNEIGFANDPLGCQWVPNSADLVLTKLTSGTLMLCNAATGKTIGPPIPYDGILSAGPQWLVWTANGERGPTQRIRLRPTEAPDHEIVLTLPIAVSRDRLVTSPDGSRMVTLHQDAPDESFQLRLWSLPDGAPLAAPVRLERKAWLLYSPDGRRIACWGKGIEVFDANTLTRVGHLPAGSFIDETKYVFSPDGRTLVTWGNAGTVDLWDLETGRPRMSPLRHGGNVASVSFSRDGRILLTSSDGLARVWSTATGELLAEPTLQLRGIPAVAFSPDGAQVTIGTQDGALYPFRLASRGVTSSPGNATRAEAEDNFAGMQGLQALRLPRTQGLPAPFLPGSSTRVLWMGETNARIIDVPTGREVGRLAYPTAIKTASLRKDAQVLVAQTAAGPWQAWWLEDNKITRTVSLDDSTGEAAWAVFSAEMDRVVLSRARRMRVWDLHTGRAAGPEITTTVNPWYAQFVNFSPDGKKVLLGSIEGQARIWEIANGKPVADFGEQPTSITQASFSPDGTRIVSGSRFGAVRLWDGRTGNPLGPWFRQTGMWGQGVFASDSRVVATFSADRMVVLRRADDGGTPQQFIEADGSLRGVRFSADDKRLVTATDEGTAQVWDVATALPITDPLKHGLMRVDAAEFSPDGRFIRTETWPDTGFHFWSVPPPPTAHSPAPTWLLEVATLCAGKRVADSGQLETERTTPEQLEALRSRVLELGENDPYAAWGRWFFADPSGRSIAPGFSLTREDAQRIYSAR